MWTEGEDKHKEGQQEQRTHGREQHQGGRQRGQQRGGHQHCTGSTSLSRGPKRQGGDASRIGTRQLLPSAREDGVGQVYTREENGGKLDGDEGKWGARGGAEKDGSKGKVAKGGRTK